MQTSMTTSMTAGVSSLNASLGEAGFACSSARMAGYLDRRNRGNQGKNLMDRADRVISVVGGAALIAAVLYFSPIMIALLERLS